MQPSVVGDGLVFAEGPRWYDGRFWVSDVHGHRIQTLNDDGTWRIEIELDDRPSGTGWLPDGTLIISSLLDCRLLRVAPGSSEVQVHSEMEGLTGRFINDMVVDGQ